MEALNRKACLERFLHKSEESEAIFRVRKRVREVIQEREKLRWTDWEV